MLVLGPAAEPGVRFSLDVCWVFVLLTQGQWLLQHNFWRSTVLLLLLLTRIPTGAVSCPEAAQGKLFLDDQLAKRNP